MVALDRLREDLWLASDALDRVGSPLHPHDTPVVCVSPWVTPAERFDRREDIHRWRESAAGRGRWIRVHLPHPGVGEVVDSPRDDRRIPVRVSSSFYFPFSSRYLCGTCHYSRRRNYEGRTRRATHHPPYLVKRQVRPHKPRPCLVSPHQRTGRPRGHHSLRPSSTNGSGAPTTIQTRWDPSVGTTTRNYLIPLKVSFSSGPQNPSP